MGWSGAAAVVFLGLKFLKTIYLVLSINGIEIAGLNSCFSIDKSLPAVMGWRKEWQSDESLISGVFQSLDRIGGFLH